MKKAIISDSTALIHLAKINKLNYLKKLFGQIIIPYIIYEEVVLQGKEEAEIPLIEKLIEEKYIIVKKVAKASSFPDLHRGETEAISLCKELGINNILIDENYGYDVATMLNLKPIRSTSIILKLLTEKIISYNEFKSSIIDLSESGYYMSAETYQKLLEEGEKYK